MKVVYMGTPRFSIPCLKALAAEPGFDVVGVFTQPDSVKRRGKKTSPSPVREAAEELGLPVFMPEGLGAEAVELLAGLAPDVVAVASYGNILPVEVLRIPRLGCYNVHASLLPRWRGAAPIERAILSGDAVTGVSIMRMDEGLDTGDWCLQAPIAVGDMDRDELNASLADLGASLMIEAISLIEAGTAAWNVQDNTRATYAAKIEKGELHLSPGVAPVENVARVRASSSHASARAVICGRPLAVTRAIIPSELGPRAAIPAPGQAVASGKRLLLGAEGGMFEILAVKPDGKKEMDAPSFLAGVHASLKSGEASWEAVGEVGR